MPSKILSIDEATLDTVSDSALKKSVRQTNVRLAKEARLQVIHLSSSGIFTICKGK